MASDLANIGLVLKNVGKHEQAVPKLVEALGIFIAIGEAYGPRQCLAGLIRCEDELGRKRMEELFKKAGLDGEAIAGLLRMIDQMRQ